MAREDVERVLLGIEAFNARDFETATRGFHPDIEWDSGSEVVPDAGIYRGREGVREFWRTWLETIDDFMLHVEEALDAGDGRVVLVTRATGSGKDSGVPVEGTLAQVFELRDDQIVRVRLFGSREAAVAAIGLHG